MRYFYFTIALSLLLSQYSHAQGTTGPKIEVTFDNTTILLNQKAAFDYTKTKNKFVISDLGGSALVAGKIVPLGNDEYATRMFFITLNKEFYNKKIIGAKDLIKALVEHNVITQKLEIDTEKLLAFIEANNEIKSFPVKKEQ
jgi:hypothetical protein